MLDKFIKEKNEIYPIYSLIISIFIFFSGLFFVDENWFFVYLFSIIIILFFFGYHKVLLRVLIISIFMASFVFLLSLISGSVDKAIQNSYRFLLLGISSTLSLSISPIKLVRALNQANFPNHLTLGLLICIRFMEVLKLEYQKIKTAMKTRGISFKNKPFSVIYRAVLIPLVSRMLSITEVLSDSLETRGYEIGNKRSSYLTVRAKTRDFVFMALIFIVILLAFFKKYNG